MATTAGDVILVDVGFQEELASNTTYTNSNALRIICVDKNSSNALAEAGSGGWFGMSSANVSMTFNGAGSLYTYGCTFRLAGASSGNSITFAADGKHVCHEKPYIWLAPHPSSQLNFRAQDGQVFIKLIDPTIRWSSSAAGVPIVSESRLEVEGGLLIADNMSPSSLLQLGTGADPGGGYVKWTGGDLSAMTTTLVNNASTASVVTVFSQCKLGSGVVPLASQTTHPNRSSNEVWLLDCSTGSTQGIFGYYNALGSVVSDTGIYFTAGSTGQSWKITTTANASFYQPFETPFISYQNTDLTSQTAYIEVLRDGSATAYNDNQLWINVMAKTTSGSPQSANFSDRMSLVGSPSAQASGAGLGSWTGESGTAWSGKIEVPSNFTPAEVGATLVRAVFAEPSSVVYIDPEVRS